MSEKVVPLRIADYFWGENGFQAVEDHLNQTKDSTTILANFMKERAQLEEMYAAKLSTILKNCSSMIEFGTTRDAWLVVKNETEATINQCKQFSEQLHRDLYLPLSRIKETQYKDKRKSLADGWKVIKDNEKLKQAFQKSKLKYEQCSSEAMKAQKALEAAKAAEKSPNDLLKLTGKAQKLSKDAMLLEHETQDACSKLAAYQTVLSDKVTEIYECLQKQEAERIEFVKINLWVYVEKFEHYISHFPVSLQKMKEGINKIDAISDMNGFVGEKTTGTVPPKPSDIVFVSNRNQTGETTLSQTPPVSIHNQLSDQTILNTSSSSFTSSSPQNSTNNSYSFVYTNVVEQEIRHLEDGELMGVCKAIYDYVGNDQYELDFFVGDVIQIYEKDASGWWTGELNGKTGLFPSNYVEELNYNTIK